MLAGRVGARSEERVAKVAVERRGEHGFSVTSIEYSERLSQDAQKARGFAAVKLFLQAAHQVQLGLDSADTDLAEVARVYCMVQGMPLGILLAAVWLGVLRPVEIAGEIDKRLDFLRADSPDVPERQHSFRAVFNRSWHLLNEREREVSQVLSVFIGGFTRSAAHRSRGRHCTG